MAKEKKAGGKVRYELLAGTHRGKGHSVGGKAEPEVYHRQPNGPPVFIDSEDDLVGMFPGKFRRVYEGEPSQEVVMRGGQPVGDTDQPEPHEVANNPSRAVPVPKTADAAQGNVGGQGTAKEDHAADEPEGDDVTAQYKLAKDNDLKVVHCTDGSYAVCGDGKVIKDGLKSTVQVRSFVKEHVQSDEE